MHRQIMKLLFLLMCLSLAKNSVAEQFIWGADYEPYYADFNNDGTLDLLLQSKSNENEHVLVIGELVDNRVTYPSENMRLLPRTISGHPWAHGLASLIVGDFNADNINDVFIVFHDLSLAYTLLGDAKGVHFSFEPNLSYSSEGFSWLDRKNDYDIYLGDFNGNKHSDLLAISKSNHKHILMHSDEKGQFHVTQEIKGNMKWGKNRADSLYIADYNNDGTDDVLAITKKKNGNNFIIFTDHEGFFSKKNIQDLGNNINGSEWFSEQYSHITKDVNKDNTLDIIKLQNAPGGYDEFGNYYPLGELPPELITEDNVRRDDVKFLPVEMDPCQQSYYSFGTNEHGLTCSPWEGETKSEGNKHVNLNSISEVSLAAAGGGTGDTRPPSTPTKAPDIVDAYNPVNKDYIINFPPYSAQYYELYESTDGSTYNRVYRGSGWVVKRNQTTYGYRYYKYKACNGYGCSGYSPYIRIFVYTAPGSPSSISSSNYTLNTKSGYEITFGASGGSVDGATYYLQESFNGGAYSTVCTKTRSHWSETSYKCPISGKATPGTYRYRVYACNPQGVGCGVTRSLSQNVTIINRAPVANNDVVSVNEGGSITISVLNNDSDPDGDSLSISSNTNPSSGSVSCSVSSCTYRASSSLSQNITTSFTYTISDGKGGSDSATVTVTVQNRKEGTVATPTITNGTFQESKSVFITTATSGASIYYRIGNSGNYSLYSGPFTVTTTASIQAYAAKHDWNNSATKTATVIINHAPNAVNDSVNVSEGGSITINVRNNDSDPDGDSLSISSNTNPSSGSVSCSVSSCTYRASSSLSQNITTSFTYTISDGKGGSDSATVTVTVQNRKEGTVATPIITNGTYQESKTVGISTATSGASIYYRVGNSGVFSLYRQPFTVTTTTLVQAYATKHDWNNSTIKSATIIINHAPTIAGTPATEINEGESFSFIPTASDSDNDNLLFSITGKPDWAIFNTSTGKLSGTPFAENAGIYANIEVSVSDGYVTVSLPVFSIEVISSTPVRKTIFIHTDILGTPVAETNENGVVQQ